MKQQPYNRLAAVAYAKRWAMARNPAFYDFSELGGDCTNFVSQCVYAGSLVMNFTPTFGWYYRSPQDRTPSWTGVDYFYNFMVNNEGPGPQMTETGPKDMRPGDVIQLGHANDDYYHTLLVTRTGLFPGVNNIAVATHTFDAYMRPLNTYEAEKMRFLHVNDA